MVLLQQKQISGERAREEVQARSAEHVVRARIQEAEQTIERQFEQNRQLQHLVLKTLDKLNEQAGQTPQVLLDVYNDASDSLKLAMNAPQQVQQALPLILGPAVSLVESAKANGLNVYDYLKHVFTLLPQATTLADVEALLPWNVARPATQSVAA